ncbi:MAG: hypothetical protein GC155_04685 [Alphaproteobacteria bacterium]|nr:hypothetical protein [Alphaproteobacteria bacterium]
MVRVSVKSQGSFSGPGAVGAGVVVAFLAITIPPAVWVVLVVCVGAGVVFYIRHKTRKAEQDRIAREQAEAAERRELDTHLAKHSRTLSVRYAGLAAANGYGTPDAPAWAKEIQRFADSVGFRPAFLAPEMVHALVTAHVEAQRQQPSSPQPSAWPAEAMNDPMAFEHACADQLRALGWDANTTGGSGDQGIDVQARKGGVRVVLQCKLYSQAVGNGAVQEALSGKAFAKAHIAAVVSNAGFTRKAHELAAATGVMLLHHTELARIDEQALRLRQAYAARKAAAAPVTASEPAGTPVERGIMGNVRKSA